VAWLVANETSESVDAAIARLIQVRPQVHLSPAHRLRLQEWAAARKWVQCGCR
jgi:hypothetical protein